jgi:hypothetical protein
VNMEWSRRMREPVIVETFVCQMLTHVYFPGFAIVYCSFVQCHLCSSCVAAFFGVKLGIISFQ